MNYEELREIGKIWILMGVFSTCFFASCGQSQTSPPESITPVTQTTPVSHEIEPKPVSIDSDYGVGNDYSEDLKDPELVESDYDDIDRYERDEPAEFTEDLPSYDQPAEVRERPTQEVSSNTHSDPNPEAALHATSGLPSEQEQASTAGSPETPDPSEDQGDDGEAPPLFAAEVDDDADADDYNAEISDDLDRG